MSTRTPLGVMLATTLATASCVNAGGHATQALPVVDGRTPDMHAVAGSGSSPPAASLSSSSARSSSLFQYGGLVGVGIPR
jgi:hypothetical protein